jgi:hypothetical protein
MRLTRKLEGGCNDVTCPAVWETDDPETIAVQGTLITDEEIIAGAGRVPGHEALVLVPRDLLYPDGR